MDALVIGATRHMNVIRVWAWMLWLSDALRTRTLLWFGHGCSGYRMRSEHERYYGMSMDALVIGCTPRNTNVIMAWAEGLRGSGCLRPTVRYYPPIPPPQPPKAKLRNQAKQGTEIPPLAKTSTVTRIATVTPAILVTVDTFRI